ncbi:MAG: hypothetical protein FWG02_09100 [Holophagaceae bacterium]|nr:hypothetical protein [Holophagaceae bacterium]
MTNPQTATIAKNSSVCSAASSKAKCASGKSFSQVLSRIKTATDKREQPQSKANLSHTISQSAIPIRQPHGYSGSKAISPEKQIRFIEMAHVPIHKNTANHHVHAMNLPEYPKYLTGLPGKKAYTPAIILDNPNHSPQHYVNVVLYNISNLPFSNGARIVHRNPITGTSYNVYRAEGFDEKNPIYIIRGIHEGKNYETILCINKINPNHASEIEIFALIFHLLDVGGLSLLNKYSEEENRALQLLINLHQKGAISAPRTMDKTGRANHYSPFEKINYIKHVLDWYNRNMEERNKYFLHIMGIEKRPENDVTDEESRFHSNLQANVLTSV